MGLWLPPRSMDIQDLRVLVDPDNQLIYIFLSNRVNPSRANNKLGSLDIRTRIQDAIYKAIDRKSQKDS